ncbi:MAG TPA: Uma2 family endonuclease, partial [Polyangiaceae bacterium]
EKLSFPEKLKRYHALGTRELVVFDIDAAAGSRLRAWDRIDHDLVERVVEGESTPCLTLGAHWVLATGGEDLPVALRLARDPQGREVLRTSEEQAKAVAEGALAEVERLRRLLADRDG